MKLFHALLSPKLCRNQLCWIGNTLRCRSCGEPAGFRYTIGDDLRVFLFPKWRIYADEIEHMTSTKQIDRIDDVLGGVSFVEFDTAIKEMKQEIEDITYHGFDGLGIYSPCDEEEFDYEEEDDGDLEEGCGNDSCADDSVCNGMDLCNASICIGRGIDPNAAADVASLDGGGSESTRRAGGRPDHYSTQE